MNSRRRMLYTSKHHIDPTEQSGNSDSGSLREARHEPIADVSLSTVVHRLGARRFARCASTSLRQRKHAPHAIAFATLRSLFNPPATPRVSNVKPPANVQTHTCQFGSTRFLPATCEAANGEQLSRRARPPAQLTHRSTGPGGSFWAGQPRGLRPAPATT